MKTSHRATTRTTVLAASACGGHGTTMTRFRTLVTAGIVLAGLASAPRVSADVVTDWNQVALATQTLVPGGIRTPSASRALAMVHLAMFDAVNGVDGRFTPYPVEGLDGEVLHPGASPEAAAAAAAHAVLVALYPGLQPALDLAYLASLSVIPDGSAKAEGISLGQSVAEAILASRASDGSSITLPYTACPPVGQPCAPGVYQPAPGEGMPALFVAWAMVTPFALKSGSQFRAEGLPALSSAEYATDYDEVRSVGRIDSPARTPDQTEAALFWRENIQIPWNRIARIAALAFNNSLQDNARLFALLNMIGADTTIAVFDTKYTFDFWRPREAIHAGDSDGNDATIGDPGWRPLGYIAAHPDYVSQHSAWGRAAAEVLASFFGTDQFAFAFTTSTAPGGVSRSYDSFSEAAIENMNSRVWLGAHFRTACRHGMNQGKQVAQYVLGHFLEPIEK